MCKAYLLKFLYFFRGESIMRVIFTEKKFGFY